MSKQCLKIISISLLTLTLVACGPKPKDKGTASSTTITTTSTSTTIDTSSSTLDSSAADLTQTSKENLSTPSSSSTVQSTPTPSSASEANHDLLKNQDEARAFLQSILTEYNNEDTVYIDFADGENNKGIYYDFKLVSKETQKNGGSGTLGIYRVYQNKTYELYPED